MFLKLFQFHWKRRDVRSFLILAVWWCWSAINRVLIKIEDWIFPGLTYLEQQIGKPTFNSVMVIGHPRSATTNVHENLTSLSTADSATNLDFVFPSLILKMIACPVIGFVDRHFLRRFETAEHAFNVSSPLEEQLWLIHLACSEDMIDVFPDILDEPALFRELIKYSPQKARFIKKCMARVIYRQSMLNKRRADRSVYVGRPLLFGVWNEDFLKEFPGAKVIICNRDPERAIGSYANLLVALTGRKLDEKFSRQYRTVYQNYSVPIYRNLQQMVFEMDPRKRYIVNFEEWKADCELQLQRMAEFCNVRISRSVKCIPKQECHTNNPQAYELIDTKDIHNDVWPAYKFVKSASVDRPVSESEVFEPTE